MKMPKASISAASAVAMILSGTVFTALVPQDAVAEDVVAEGKKIAFHRKKGNCLACHAIEGGNLPGNIGPPLVNMKERYPDKQALRMQIYDATKNNPNTIMPPFGKHEILTSKELDKVVEYIWTL
jgi:sulfur-oxidizing protein SoxX